MKYISTIFFGVLMCSCSHSNKEVPNPDPIPVVNRVGIYFTNENGNELFTVAGNNGYVKDSFAINIISPNSYKDIVVFMGWANVLDSAISTDSILATQFYVQNLNNIPSRYCFAKVHMKQNVDDTLKMFIAEGGGIDSIWYNRILKYAATAQIYEPIITVQKEE